MMFEKLKQGDTIGIFSSSAPVTITSQLRYELIYETKDKKHRLFL